MKAAIFQGLGQPLVIGEVPDPRPGLGEMVLRVRNCGICGTDLHAASRPPGPPAGTVMGHEFSGEVVEVGRGGDGQWRTGDRVCSLPAIGCGACQACMDGDITQCARMRATGLGQIPGAYSEYVVAGMNESFRLPEGVSFRDGALVEPLAVGLHAVKAANLKPAERVLVIGAGPIGLAVTSWARFFGAAVVVSERLPERLALAGKMGAAAVVDSTKEDAVAVVQRETGGPPGVVFECVGAPRLIQQCMDMTRVRGRVIVVGVCTQPDTIFPLRGILKEVELRFVFGYQKNDFQLVLEMLDRGRISGREMITDLVDLANFPSAFEALKKPTTQCKAMLEI